MKTITYSQTWPESDLYRPRLDEVESVFETDEVVWLMDQGFEPTLTQRAIPYRAQWVYTLTFCVPDTVLTYINLRWPQARNTIEVGLAEPGQNWRV